MKLKDGLMLREIAGQWVVVPMGKMIVQFSGIITLNESGVLLWKGIEQGHDKDELLGLLLSEYDIDVETAKNDIDEFVNSIIEKDLLVL